MFSVEDARDLRRTLHIDGIGDAHREALAAVEALTSALRRREEAYALLGYPHPEESWATRPYLGINAAEPFFNTHMSRTADIVRTFPRRLIEENA